MVEHPQASHGFSSHACLMGISEREKWLCVLKPLVGHPYDGGKIKS
jgi:hypothetical protein